MPDSQPLGQHPDCFFDEIVAVDFAEWNPSLNSDAPHFFGFGDLPDLD
jgi:hypothetical protein